MNSVEMKSENQPAAPARAAAAPCGNGGFWRSLEELADSAAFQEKILQEFPHAQEHWRDPVSRRQFLMLMGASLGLAGLSGCSSSAPEQPILPYVRQPEQVVPGQPLFYATAMPQSGYGFGVLVESHEGRPTKIEGNPDHPACPKPVESSPTAKFGPTNAFAQASILTLYDPDRSHNVTHLGSINTWDAFVAALFAAVPNPRENLRLRVLTETVTSPTLALQLRALLRQFAQARWHSYEPVGRENVRLGAQLAFGEIVETHYRLDRADAIVALDADFLSCGPAHVRHHQEFASRRRARGAHPGRNMNRLYVVESTTTTTGAAADHRLPVKPTDVEFVARELAGQVDTRFRGLETRGNRRLIPRLRSWFEIVARDLRQHRGASLVIAGESQPPFVHALAHALNSALDNVGRTVSYSEAIEVLPSENGSLKDLVDDMAAGRVDALLILGGNPAYTAPADLDFAARLQRVPFRAHLSLYEDETSALCHWHVPEAHYLESWGDVRAHDGTVSIIQPLIAPLYGGKTAGEVLAVLTGQAGSMSYEIVRTYWQGRLNAAPPTGFRGNFESWWQTALHDGLIAGSRLPTKTASLRSNWMQSELAAAQGEGLEIVFRPDPTIHDGRFANNGWLQELPKPLSKLTWDNAIFISPATAVRLGFAPTDHPEQANEQEADLEYQGRAVSGPLFVLPGHPDDVVTVHLGYGRTRAGRVGIGIGFDAYQLRMWSAPWFGAGATLRLTGRRHPLARTQQHHLMENRDLVRTGTPGEPPEMPRPTRRSLTLYNDSEHLHAADQWGMVIDQSLCTGCSACIVACQAENNIPVVGKDQVQRGREMHWLRVDSYYQGDAANPATYFQPVPCMHCENAPCELVCPVGATVHSSDGLNDMVYNRCVGTRYCSNNCPYKVRRFNFYEFADWNTASLRLLRNPEVSVRSRGVMEKCTYCVQRIRAGQIHAGREDRAVRDGEVVTACQSACPAGAIVFGNLADRASKVAQLQEEPYRYSLLADLNTRPRTTYLAAFRNPNPDMLALEGGG
jgi:MoCo/4Fe-4S cofactor protein with predicted Tat translocation signal